MDNKEIVIVLKEFRRLSWIITVYNREKFRNTNGSEFWRNIGAAFFLTLCLVMLFLVLVTGVWYCFDCEFDIKESSMAAPIAISVVQMLAMYAAVAINNRTISRMILDLQKIIERRKLFRDLFHFLSATIFFHFIFALLGQNSYKKVERKHAFITKVFYNTIMGITAFFFTLSVLWPVFYALFGHPTPSHWVLPLDFQ